MRRLSLPTASVISDAKRVGAFVATYLGQAIGWYKAGAGAGLIGAVVGAVILLVIWGFFIAPKTSA